QQQHRGLCGKRQSYAEQPLLAVRKRAGNFRRAALESDHTQELTRFVGKLAFRDLLARQRQQRVPQARPSPAVQSDQHVFEYGVVLEYARALERPDQAKTCDFVWPEAVQQRVAVANFASRGLEKTGEHVECGGLARAVRANEADDFSLANRESEIGKGDEPAEMHRDMLDRKDHVLRCNARRHHCPPRDSELPAAIAPAGLRVDPAQFAMERSSAGTIPCGRTKTIAIIKPP